MKDLLTGPVYFKDSLLIEGVKGKGSVWFIQLGSQRKHGKRECYVVLVDTGSVVLTCVIIKYNAPLWISLWFVTKLKLYASQQHSHRFHVLL